MIESYLVSSGLLKRYNALDVGKIQYLAIVVDSEDTYKFSKVLQLLKWLEAIGVRHLCLYDSKGKDAGYSVKLSHWGHSFTIIDFTIDCKHMEITLNIQFKIVFLSYIFSSRSSQNIQENHRKEFEKCNAIWGIIFYLYYIFFYLFFSFVDRIYFYIKTLPFIYLVDMWFWLGCHFKRFEYVPLPSGFIGSCWKRFATGWEKNDSGIHF